MKTMRFTNETNSEDTGNEVDNREIIGILKAVPGSYEDFVYSTAECMRQDDNLKDLILNQLRTRPESDSSDVLKILCNYYGFNKPIKLDDDDDDSLPLEGAISPHLRGATY